MSNIQSGADTDMGAQNFGPAIQCPTGLKSVKEEFKWMESKCANYLLGVFYVCLLEC